MSDTYDDRFIRINNRLDSYEQALDILQSLIHKALGPCTKCNGSGKVYIEDIIGDTCQTACDICKGAGKKPLDYQEMIEHFKREAQNQIQTETDIPF